MKIESRTRVESDCATNKETTGNTIITGKQNRILIKKQLEAQATNRPRKNQPAL